MLRAASTGLLWGALAALPAGLWRLAAGGEGWSGLPLTIVGVALLFVVPIVMAALAASRPITPGEAARRVDRHYGLSDRTVTALFLADGPDNPLTRIQLAGTLRQLDRVEPACVVPMKLPRLLLPAVCAAGVAVALAVWPVDGRVTLSVEDGLHEAPPSTAAADPWEPADGASGRKIAGQIAPADFSTDRPGHDHPPPSREPTMLNLEGMIDRYFDAPR